MATVSPWRCFSVLDRLRGKPVEAIESARKQHNMCSRALWVCLAMRFTTGDFFEAFTDRGNACKKSDDLETMFKDDHGSMYYIWIRLVTS